MFIEDECKTTTSIECLLITSATSRSSNSVESRGLPPTTLLTHVLIDHHLSIQDSQVSHNAAVTPYRYALQHVALGYRPIVFHPRCHQL